MLAANEFLHSQIIVNGTAIANGSDQLSVYLRLLNSDNSPVVGFQPQYSVSLPENLVLSQCFVSDANGLSICVLKAQLPGVHDFQVTNVSAVQLEKSITFEPTPSSPISGQMSAGSASTQNVGIYQISGNAGVITNLPVQTVGPWKVFGSVQAANAAGAGGSL